MPALPGLETDGHLATDVGRDSAGGRLSRLLRSVPKPLGAAWDVLLLCALMFLLAACVDSAIDPQSDSFAPGTPLAIRVTLYLCLFATLFLPAAFILCDRRPLERVVKSLRRVSLQKQIGFALAAMIVGVVAVGLVVSFFAPA